MPECACGFTCGTPVALARHQASCQEGGASSARGSKGRRCRSVEVPCAPDSPSGLEGELQALRAQLHEQEWKLRRAEAEHEKSLAAYTRFVQDVVASSSSPTLDNYVDLRTKEILGSGHFGYVFTCRARPGAFSSQDSRGPERIVVKVQSARQADSVVREWHHGSARGQHPHMVEHYKVLMHLDTNEELKKFLEDAFSSGALKGKPRAMPDKWLCILEEYMDGGTAQYLMDKKLLQTEGIAAILRQVADAVSCLHQSQETHNDIKPENVLLKVDSKRGGRVKLVAKLADMGSAEYSMDRTRDLDLLAYTVWCMVMGAAFKKCPAGGEERRAAARELREAAASWPDGQLRQRLPDVVEQLWRGSCDLNDLSDAPWLRGCEVTVPEELPAGTDLRGAARKSIISTERRRSSLMSRIKCVIALSPRGNRESIDFDGLKEVSRVSSMVSDGLTSSDDSDSAMEAVSRTSSLAPPPAAGMRSASSSSRLRRNFDADRDGSFSPAIGRSSSAGLGFRGARRGAAARQGRPSEEGPKPPASARPPGGLPPRRLAGAAAKQLGGGVAGTDSEAEDFRGSATLLAKSSGAVAGSESKESCAKVDNLMRRFPSRSRDEILEVLREACGHAGHAADMLRKAAA